MVCSISNVYYMCYLLNHKAYYKYRLFDYMREIGGVFVLKDFLQYILKSCGIPIGFGLIAYIVFTGMPYKLACNFTDWLLSITGWTDYQFSIAQVIFVAILVGVVIIGAAVNDFKDTCT